MSEAVAAVKNDLGSIRSIAAKFNIPRTTLQDHVNEVWKKRNQIIGRKNHIGAGRPTEITIEVENYIVHGIQYLGSIGWPIEPR